MNILCFCSLWWWLPGWNMNMLLIKGDRIVLWPCCLHVTSPLEFTPNKSNKFTNDDDYDDEDDDDAPFCGCVSCCIVVVFMHCFVFLCVLVVAPRVKCAYLMMMNGGAICWWFYGWHVLTSLKSNKWTNEQFCHMFFESFVSLFFQFLLFSSCFLSFLIFGCVFLILHVDFFSTIMFLFFFIWIMLFMVIFNCLLYNN